MSVSVSTILDRKGREVVTTSADVTLADAVAELHRRRIGALVVTDRQGHPEGVLSERDVVRCLARHGGAALQASVADAMSAPVHTCTPDATTDELMSTMTERRIRHLPVLRDGRLVGIVSIGDVVKWRFEELRDQTRQLEDYVAGSY